MFIPFYSPWTIWTQTSNKFASARSQRTKSSGPECERGSWTAAQTQTHKTQRDGVTAARLRVVGLTSAPGEQSDASLNLHRPCAEKKSCMSKSWDDVWVHAETWDTLRYTTAHESLQRDTAGRPECIFWVFPGYLDILIHVQVIQWMEKSDMVTHKH